MLRKRIYNRPERLPALGGGIWLRDDAWNRRPAAAWCCGCGTWTTRRPGRSSWTSTSRSSTAWRTQGLQDSDARDLCLDVVPRRGRRAIDLLGPRPRPRAVPRLAVRHRPQFVPEVPQPPGSPAKRHRSDDRTGAAGGTAGERPPGGGRVRAGVPPADLPLGGRAGPARVRGLHLAGVLGRPESRIGQWPRWPRRCA